MELFSIFASTFLLVFIGELGDKTQIATGAGTLANRNYIRTVFISSALALVSVAGLTVFFAGLIPESALPTIQTVGGGLLILYGIYLFKQARVIDTESESDSPPQNESVLFFSHFAVVFIAELGDKTQIATLALAIENRLHLPLIFLGSASALVSVTALTIWGVTKIPGRWVIDIQKLGALLLVIYGLYMLIS